MGISLLAYVATFSGQFYFRGRFFFTLLQSSHFGTSYFFEAAISSEHLIFLRSFFFAAVTFFSKQLLFQGKTYFGQLPHENREFFRVVTFWNSYLFSRGIVQNKYIYRRATFSKQVLLQNISFFRKGKFWKKANFSVKQYSALATFSGELPFQSSYFLKRRYLNILFQKSYQFTAALPFHNYNSYLSVSN